MAETQYEHIVLDEAGVPLIAGTTMKVVELVLDCRAYKWSPEELHFQHPYLSLGQIHSALAYYWDHKVELDQDIARRRERMKSLRATTATGAPMGDSWPLEERLANIAADLVSYRRFEPFLHKLFAASPGNWRMVADCCSGMIELPEFAWDIFAEEADEFWVAHLLWPGTPPTPNGRYSLILFAHGATGWHTVAAYNHDVLTRPAADHSGD